MFSRRHPYLFFFLIFSSVGAACLIIISFLFINGIKASNLTEIGKVRGDKVGIVEIKGIITDAQHIIQKIIHFRDDKSVKAIVLRINSPGGSVGPSQEIYREISKAVKLKKIIVSMGNIATSGGYYVAAGADGIVANPGTITGSIGVVMGFTNYRNLLDKIGLVPVVVKSCEYKDIGSPAREMTKEENEFLQSFVNKIHNQFVKAVSEGRKMDRSKVEAIADGRIFTGEEAKGIGLVDRLGNLEDAVEWAGRMVGIKGKINTVYAREKNFSIMKYLTSSFIKELVKQVAYPQLQAEYICRPS